MGQTTGDDWDIHIGYNDLPCGVSHFKVTTTTYTGSDLEVLRKQEHQAETKEDEQKEGKMGLDIDVDSVYEPEMGDEAPFEAQEQKPLEAPEQEVQEVQQAPVAVMEMDEFYKTEVGQKALAEPYNKRYSDTIENTADNSYAIRRDDRYFLVRSGCANIFPGKHLTINKQYFIYPIKENGKVDESNIIRSFMEVQFDYKERLGKIVFIPDPYDEHINPQKDVKVKTQVYAGHGGTITDNNIFNKFIAPDAHWFECVTHTASRKQVLKGKAGISIFNEAQYKIGKLLEEKEANQSPAARKINSFIKKWNDRKATKENIQNITKNCDQNQRSR